MPPWHLYRGMEDGDGDIPEGVEDEAREGKKESDVKKGEKPEYVYVEVVEKVPRE